MIGHYTQLAVVTLPHPVTSSLSACDLTPLMHQLAGILGREKERAQYTQELVDIRYPKGPKGMISGELN